MNELALTISRLFEPDKQPVIGISGGIVLFYNTAALGLLPTLSQGQRASASLPETLLACDEEVFVSTAHIGKQSVSACGVWFSGMLLLRLDTTPPRYDFSPEALAAGLRPELANTRLALDQLARSCDLENADIRACFSVLNRSYYKQLRTCENIALASNIAQHTVVYKPRPTDLPLLIRKLTAAVSQTAVRNGVDIRCACTGEIQPILADPELLEHMLLNLFSNSLRHTKPGDTIELHLTAKGSRLLLTLEDTGSGISPELLGTLFTHTAEDGSVSPGSSGGLGLFIVWGGAEMHGGSVTITNRRRGGASVRIWLPRSGTIGQLHAPSIHAYASARAQGGALLTALADALPPEAFALRTKD